MDPKRFDNWTRSRALRFSRRDALRLAGASGASAALAAHSPNTHAQTTCTLTVHAETIGGPSAPATYDGTLQFSVGSDGGLTQASFTPATGAPARVSGVRAGFAFDLQIALGSGQILTLSGASDQKTPACPTAAAGTLAGPQPGDLGAWQATSAGGAPAAPPLTTSGQSTGGQPSNPGCAPGQTPCAGTCVAACSNGQTLDSNSCSCTSTCKPDQGLCQFDAECCGGFCDITSGTCAACPGLVCGEMGCVDQTTDPFNCGTCGRVCVDDTGFCLGGVCQCIPDGEPMGSSSSSCCSQGMVDPNGRCGCSHLGEWCSSTGQCCDSGSGAICVAGDSGFDECCLSVGNTCASDADCCFSGPGFTPQTACINGVCATKT